eukprot:TRINITY_DN87798_c0_g1_i1.p1 TRINITY_DN87798_c0_g1~~TRINITY_DN87798_c0_g1_i1.p1  ORF type:complete len:684 (+),score=148.41 TRINITY_DN87798_c0_g1_i1:67-2052(+)
MTSQGDRKRVRGDREGSIDSRDDDRKRKRDKTDKKKDKGDRRDKGDDRKNKKRETEVWNRDADPRGAGYGGQEELARRSSKRPSGPGDLDDRDRRRGDRINEPPSDPRSDRDRRSSDHRHDRDKSRRGDRNEHDAHDDGVTPNRQPPQPPPPPTKQQQQQNWRDEADDEGEDLRDVSDDEEAEARKLEESRKRRAALLAQAKPDKKTEEEEQPQPESKDTKEGTEKDDTKAGDKKTQDAKEGSEKDDTKTGDKSADVVGKAEEDTGAGDMFDLNADAKALKGAARSKNKGLAGASTDDWDDEEGYYIAQLGEVLEDRYQVQDTVSGRGVFSNVVKAKDLKSPGAPQVALKIIRSNDMMKKQAEKEIEILQMLNNADKGNKRHIIRLVETFYYRKHIFLVFECMARDLRGAVKELTKGRGMSMPAVKAYTKQLLVGTRHMHKFNIIHADIKPDNILISADNNIVKLCDFGTAIEAKDIGVSPYCMSRFYRPGEVILGCEYGLPVDVWALACTLFEIFTGKTLFQGKTNNDMLKRIMDVKGKLPKHVIKKGAVWKNHFDENLDFKFIDKDSMTGEEITRVITDNTAKKQIREYVLDRVGPDKQKSEQREDQQYVKKSIHMADLLDKMTALDPQNRLTAEDALKHHFVEEPKSSKAASGGTPGK